MQVWIKIDKNTWKITSIIKDTNNSWLKYDTLVTLTEEQEKKLENTNTHFKKLCEELSIYFKKTIDNLIVNKNNN